MKSRDELLTATEASKYLKVSIRTLYRWVYAGKIPVARVGRQWRFRKGKLDAWIDNQENTVRR